MDHSARMAETHSPASDTTVAAPLTAASYGHSTLEVAPPGAGLDSEKIVVPRPLDYDKIVVPQQPYGPSHGQHQQGLQTPYPQSGVPWGYQWDGHGDAGAVKEERMLGLKRRTFFIALWVILFVVALAVGLGAGLGVTMGSRNSSGSAAITGGDGASTSTRDTTAAPSQTPPRTSSIAESTTSPSQTSSAPQSTGSLRVGNDGGRCAGQWGSDCICLEEGICRNRWQGTPYTGYTGNWPCPDDSDDVMACVVKPCLGKLDPAQCLWKEACRELSPGNTSAPICPGDGDFVCCAHSW